MWWREHYSFASRHLYGEPDKKKKRTKHFCCYLTSILPPCDLYLCPLLTSHVFAAALAVRLRVSRGMFVGRCLVPHNRYGSV